MTEPLGETPPTEFLLTKEYWRFVEFCDSCRQYQYIGICYGLSGVGKTLSAQYYAHTNLIQRVRPHHLVDDSPLAAISPHHTVLYTPPVANSPRKVLSEVTRLRTQRTAWAPLIARSTALLHGKADPSELLIVDEADRLKLTGMEQLRDIYDRRAMGLVLIGIPGLEKRVARYPQFYSRVGFVHAFRPVEPEDLETILAHKWQQTGIPYNADDQSSAEALKAMMRVTGGNLRLIQRLFAQLERLLPLNNVHTITPRLVELARESLVIGR